VFEYTVKWLATTFWTESLKRRDRLGNVGIGVSEDNIHIDLNKISGLYEGVDWIELLRGRVRWRRPALVNMRIDQMGDCDFSKVDSSPCCY
jgi:hypothetical protein